MTYLPPTEPRCVALRCQKAASCARHKAAPGGSHPVSDLSIYMVAGSCGYWEPLNRWMEPKAEKPGHRVHECPEGLR